VLQLLNKFARVPISGLIAQYNAVGPADGTDRPPAPWARFYGSIRYREDIVDHLEKAPEAFIGMLDGHNYGKAIVRVAA